MFGKLINRNILLEPMNWLIIGVIATLWLLAFHAVMQGFTAMQAKETPLTTAPGQVSLGNASGTVVNNSMSLSPYQDTSPSMFTNASESPYAESNGTFAY